MERSWTPETAQFSNRADFKYSSSLKCGQSAVRVNTYSTGFFKREGIENYIWPTPPSPHPK